MKKIIIQPISMSMMKSKTEYKVHADKFGALAEPVYYSMSGITEQFLQEGDDVKVIAITSAGGDKSSQNIINHNTTICSDEYKDLCERKKASIEFKEINVQYDISNKYYETMFSQIISEIDENSDLYVDITLGDRFIPVFLFAIVQFAEQCLGCELKVMSWAKRGYNEKGEVLKDSYLLTDITSIYYLNKITGTLHSSNGKDAIKTVQDFLSI